MLKRAYAIRIMSALATVNHNTALVYVTLVKLTVKYETCVIYSILINTNIDDRMIIIDINELIYFRSCFKSIKVK